MNQDQLGSSNERMGAVRFTWRSFVACLTGVVLCFAAWSASVAVGAEVSSSGSTSSSFGDPLVIAGGEELVGDRLAEAEAVKRANPEAVAARGVSSSAYEGLGSEAARRVADEAFAGVISEPSGGPPRLPSGQKILSYLSANAASLELPGGMKGVVYSQAPIAAEGSGGQRVPIDLSLIQNADGFEPKVPAAGVQVRIPKRLADGPSLAASGVGLTPVNEQGVALGGSEGVEDGASVFYGDTEASGVTDVDTLVKPDTLGLSTETILRSQRSPDRLFFRVSLPSGASLVGEHSGAADVVYAGQVIAMILPAKARDAEGTDVPVSSSLSGNTLELKVEHQPGEYLMPIDVDPIATEGQSMGRYQMGRGWWFSANSPGGVFTNYEPKYGVDGMEDHDPYSNHYKAGEYGLFGYETKGESRIDEFVSESYDNNPATISSTVYIGGPGGLESAVHTAEWTPTTVCVTEGCTAPVGSSSHWANGVFYKQSALAEEYWSFEDLLRSATVYIMQEKAPSVTSLGSCGSTWTNISICGVEWSAFDPGIGVNEFTLSSPSASGWGTTEKSYCEGGVQCSEHVSGRVSLTGLPEGEDTIKATVKDPVGLSGGPTEHVVKIDNVAPHNIALSGLPTANEIGAGEYHLKAEATDGVTGTVSSGVKSITLLIDGRSVGVPSGSCSLGPCTAHGEWTIAGREYGTGHHTITVIATDNAGNTAQETYAMIVHAPSPVATGPGQVNPQSGEFSLSATDVSMGGGLTVNRSYRSRHLTTGMEGPISAQWGFALGGNETLAKQADGSMVLTDSSGAQTSFAPDGKGGFISPAGDANLTLSSKPCVVGQTEYMLSDTAAKTTTCFKSPTGSSEVLLPSISEGAVATDTVSYSYEVAKTSEYSLPKESQPRDIVRGPDGNLWFTDYRTSRIGKITTSGTVSEYHVPEGSEPVGITSGPDGNLWFTDLRTSKVGKITTSGAITEYSLPASSYPVEITTGSDKNLWITEEYTNKIVKMTTAGVATEYSLPAGSGPEGITSGPDGNLWFVDREKSKVAKMTTSGVVTEYSLPAESYPEGIVTGPDKNLWFTDEWSNKIGKITTAGAITEYALPAEARPHEITVGPDENLWFTEANARIGKITTTGAVSEFSVPWESSPEGIVAGPDGYVWYTEESTSKIAKTLPLNAPNQPAEALGPIPAGVSCSPELKPGCRALTFNYAATTTAILGENSSQWGSYSGHLSGVSYTAYDPVSKAMKTAEVAHYLYDSQGRLRAEWDPRISPALKTTYGYDSEGHVTALTMPGQESWAFAYGMIASDSGTGRLLKANQATASTALWNGEATKYTEMPKLSGEAFVGTRMTVSDGLWTLSPVLYGYQWEDCNSSGTGCVAIPGANNANYTPVSGDEGHKLVAQVTAINGDGAVSASSVASAVVKSGHGTEGAVRGAQPGTTIEYGVALSGTGLPTMTKTEVEKWGQKDFPTEATAIFPPDEPQTWPASDYKRATIYYRDSTSRTTNVETPGGAVATTEYNEQNDVTRSLSADNRATALKEGAKSAEVSKTLDTQSTYSTDGTELLSTLGPQHTVKLAAGGEVQARSHTAYTYDEGAPSEGGPYRLVTKMTQGAEVAGKEEDVRTTRTYYSGQKGLGWKLRKPTSIVTDPAGLDLVHSTVYNETTGNIVETKTPGGTSEVVYPPSYSAEFGSEGSGKGQFNQPFGVALDSSGNVWVDDRENGRIQELSATGTFIAEYGSKGTGNNQFSEASGIAIAPATGNVYVADTGNNRIEELNSSGGFVKTFGTEGSGLLSKPRGVTVDSFGDVWVSDTGHNRIVEFSSTGTFTQESGSYGSGNKQFNEPEGVTMAEGSLFVVDAGNDRIEQFSLSGGYLGQFGTKGSSAGQFKEPAGIAANPTTGNLYISDYGNNRMEQFTPAGKFLTEWGMWSEAHELYSPTGLAISATGKLYIADVWAAKVSVWLPPETGGANLHYASQFGSKGTGSGQFYWAVGSALDGHGNLWVTDETNDRVQEFSSTGSFIAAYGKEGTGEVQFHGPQGIDVNQSTGNVYIADSGNNRIEEISSTGTYVRGFGTSGSGLLSHPDGLKIDSSGNVWVADTNNDRIVEFSPTGTYVAAYGTKGAGEDQFNEPFYIAFSGPNLYITDHGNNRVEELSPEGKYLGQFGIKGSGSSEFYGPEGIAGDSAGNLYIVDNGDSRVEEFSASGAFRASFASAGSGEGQLTYPSGITINAAGDMYVVDSGDDRIEEWTPVNQAVHDTKTIYYTAKTEAEATECRNHPEWAMLPCITEPAAQPETAGLPQLPVTITTYDMYGQPTNTTSTVGTDTKVATVVYDEAGRVLATELTSTVGKALPVVSTKYDGATGLPTEQSAVIEGKTQTVTTAFNALGQVTGYTDADGNITKYEYETEKDARLVRVNDGKGTKEYTYDETTGFQKAAVDTQGTNVLTFTAAYDPEGNLISETYPNGMSANYTLNQTGQMTAVNYVKTTHCAEKCTWLSDTVVPSIHGQWMSQQSTLATQNYSYDEAGRLTQVQETPATEGCTTRIYGYDEETNRTNLTTRAPGVGGACGSEGGTTERHSYDSANRLTDAGVVYDSFGDTTKLPATDAGGSELQNSFYSDGQLEGQTQNGQTIAYQLDPTGRTRETVDTGTVSSTTINHYAGPGDSPAWTVEPVSGHWSRNVSGISGFAAIETDAKEPILQLSDLQGNIIATASISETATKLLGTERPTEYGVPTTTKPAKYSWLGSDLRATELSSGVTAMGARSYIPQLGRFLQTDPIPGGSANAYTYVFGDPVNSSDPSGESSNGPSSWALGLAAQITGEEVAAYEAALRAEAERKAAEAAAAAAAYAALEAATALPMLPEGEEEETGGGGRGGGGGGPVASVATRAKTPQGRFAEAKCDGERDYLESAGYEIGDFTGRLQTEPGGRYKGTSYELLYVVKPAFAAASSGGPHFLQESTCHVIVNEVDGHNHVTHGPHFRIGQGLDMEA